jgi:hypothetical protein
MNGWHFEKQNPARGRKYCAPRMRELRTHGQKRRHAKHGGVHSAFEDHPRQQFYGLQVVLGQKQIVIAMNNCIGCHEACRFVEVPQ